MSDRIEKKFSEIRSIYELLTELSKREDSEFIEFYRENVQKKLSDNYLKEIEEGYNKLNDILRYDHPDVGDAITLRGKVDALNGTLKTVKNPIITQIYSAGSKKMGDSEALIKYAGNTVRMNELMDWLSKWNSHIIEFTNRYIKCLPAPEDMSLVKHNESLRNVIDTIFMKGCIWEEWMQGETMRKLEKYGLISADTKDGKKRFFLTNKGVNVHNTLHAK